MAFQNILPKKREELPRPPAELKKKGKKKFEPRRDGN
ncbi:hypothetical protein SAMN05421748_1625 [Paractinoplanes atraurantiacus]|uniref:Uncharacterized protein n=1 Tax=Paractinoplanes atraurantiacus TaxID=1036182 RepID=A0A285KTL0_9ACTN|nr:hypothetical protein SAMN05421748_1625 [Actinoplanes atraurantiacus]